MSVKYYSYLFSRYEILVLTKNKKINAVKCASIDLKLLNILSNFTVTDMSEEDKKWSLTKT